MTTKEINTIKELLAKPLPYELIDMSRWIAEAKAVLAALVATK